MSSRPLRNVRVLDLTQALAGPFATMILGDLGADVIKVEAPKGDLTRMTPPYYAGDTSLYFIANNRNKRSVVLDLKQEAHLEAFYALTAKADVVFSNFSTGVVERLRIDHDTLARINPALITCNITGYGRRGPKAHRRAVDVIVQSIAGAMSITGEPGGRPVRAGVPSGDLSAGLYAVIGILAALHARRETGRGMRVDGSLFHSQLSLLNYMATYAIASGRSPEKVGSGHPGTVPSQVFETADGWITIDAGFNQHFREFCALMGFPELADDPRFKERPARALNREPLLARISAEVRKYTTAALLEMLDSRGIPCGPVNDVLSAVADPQSVEYQSVRTVAFAGTEVPVLATPIWFGDATLHPLNPPPRLGEHTEQVLRDVAGLPKDRIAAVVGASTQRTQESSRRQA